MIKMIMKKKFYITTPIYYPNEVPHLGTAYTTILADTLARYHRKKGEEVLFVTGTDEHGNKIAQTAKKLGKDPKEFTDEMIIQFKNAWKILNISNDDFIRTTDKERHWPAVEKVWLKLKENGDIYKKKYKGLYCLGCEAFVKEKELIDGKCPFHKKVPQVIEEENYFFRLSRYEKELKRIVEKDEFKIIPETKKSELLSFISQGLEDISCSRPKEKLKWGIPVPNDEDQTIYVWFDALVNYLSVLDYHKEGEKQKNN
jgi:methionyl-tRNA synthetase